ncbi:16S rRNA (cytosine(1402)-N(4))-methyltransferase RsmH [Hyphobacterium sp. CCMP332]|nr:16S rRNA (cytosine(1402)-N(4))-methyltransferase RsmH [Hyphobacterium sp. CCMP332]
MEYHQPVMLRECVEGLQCGGGGTFVDVTFGGGGHSKAILEEMDGGRLYGFDQDSDAKKNASEIEDTRFTFVDANFQHLKKYLRLYKVKEVDGILADLGVSSHQFDVADRGFSFRFPEAELDMRMDAKAGNSAAEILNSYEFNDLRRILREYGELNNAHRIAKAIVDARGEKEIKTVSDLLSIIDPICPIKKQNKYRAQVFQALRMEVNSEIDSLKELLIQSEEVLVSGGRMVVMSYHSLEDRLVKNFFRKGKFEGEDEKDLYGNVLKPMDEVNRRPIIPGDKEIEMNPRARSAKLRIAKKR